jgi:hypothetical protein
MNSKKLKLLAVGCSYTRGHGLENDIHNTDLWVNRLANAIGADVVNRSLSGANNEWIFLETLSELRKSHYDIVLVGWSAIPRYRFYAGLELYTVSTILSAFNNSDIHINNRETVSAKWQKDTGDRLRRIHNDHWDILTLIKYVNTLVEIQKTVRHGKIFFVNALGPWCNDYFEFKKTSLPSELDPYVQQLLNVDTRDDTEIFDIYSMMHQQYREYGGINESHWLNLYQSLNSMKIDTISNVDRHPGIKSQAVFEEFLLPAFLEKYNKNK